MALAKKCDICGKFYEPYATEYDRQSVNGLAIVFVKEDGGYRTPPDAITDCCPECMKAIIHYIDGLRNGTGDESKVNVAEKEVESEPEKRCVDCAYMGRYLYEQPCQSCENHDKWVTLVYE